MERAAPHKRNAIGDCLSSLYHLDENLTLGHDSTFVPERRTQIEMFLLACFVSMHTLTINILNSAYTNITFITYCDLRRPMGLKKNALKGQEQR